MDNAEPQNQAPIPNPIKDRHVTKRDLHVFQSPLDDVTKEIRKRTKAHLDTGCKKCIELNRKVLQELLDAKKISDEELAQNRFFR